MRHLAALPVLAALTWGAVSFINHHVAEQHPRVVDGDTLAAGEERIRLTGLDAPELAQMCGDFVCGLAAKARLQTLIGAKVVTCSKQGRDRYGRTLARCEAGGIDLAGEMVREGWAVINPRYPSPYFADQAVAIATHRGLWALTFEAPWKWREEHPR